ncbi:hypothetical protein LPJ64_006383 [Coemansia asiatica]|uniref:Uncharacterized protein n=1 Tax=Coemansia asiatica TaxID=1052880 RepID=A0A9W7XF86_9FUNG|nr:hypothetical protein LPJ64_006383 [Coemansia asiatica]
MDTQRNFVSRIVSKFINEPEYNPLQILVFDLREKLIDNPNVSKLARGAMAVTNILLRFQPKIDVEENHWDSKCSKDERDPFVRRAACADLIADDLLKVMIQARKEAVSRLYRSNE